MATVTSALVHWVSWRSLGSFGAHQTWSSACTQSLVTVLPSCMKFSDITRVLRAFVLRDKVARLQDCPHAIAMEAGPPFGPPLIDQCTGAAMRIQTS